MEDQQALEHQHYNQQAMYLAALQQQQLHAQLHAHQQTIMQLQAMAHQNHNPAYNFLSSIEHTQESLSNKKLSDIKDILKQMRKKVTGNKEDLIARILGIEETNSASPSPRTPVKKRKFDEVGDDSEEYEENDEITSPRFKRLRIDKNDPVMLKCFLCHSTNDLVKYKDIKECLKCKHSWKGRRLFEEEACQMFCLEPEDLSKLPHKEQASQTNGTQPTPLYAFATAAGAAVKKYGSLYHMIRANHNQREMLAQYIQHQHFQQHALLQQQLFQQQFQQPGIMMSYGDILHLQQQQQQQQLKPIQSVPSDEHTAQPNGVISPQLESAVQHHRILSMDPSSQDRPVPPHAHLTHSSEQNIDESEHIHHLQVKQQQQPHHCSPQSCEADLSSIAPPQSSLGAGGSGDSSAACTQNSESSTPCINNNVTSVNNSGNNGNSINTESNEQQAQQHPNVTNGSNNLNSIDYNGQEHDHEESVSSSSSLPPAHHFNRHPLLRTTTLPPPSSAYNSLVQ